MYHIDSAKYTQRFVPIVLKYYPSNTCQVGLLTGSGILQRISRTLHNCSRANSRVLREKYARLHTHRDTTLDADN